MDIRRRDTPEAREFWDSVSRAAQYVRAHFLCYSHMCQVNRGGRCESPNAIDRRVARDMASLDEQGDA